MEDVKTFFYPLLEVAVVDIIKNHKNEDPKSKLQEWAQANGYLPPKYSTINVQGPDHSKVFEIEVKVNNKLLGNGVAKSKQSAEKLAAQNALKQINNE
jgi:ribonuclease-3